MKEEKVPVTCPVYSTVTGEVVAEIKSDEPIKVEEPKIEAVVSEPTSEPVEHEAELNSLFQMVCQHTF